MKLVNYSKDQYLSVINDRGETEQANPGSEVSVSDSEGALILMNYSHIFRKIETESDTHTLQNKVTTLENALVERDQEIIKLNAHIVKLEEALADAGVETKDEEDVGETGEGSEGEEKKLTPEEINAQNEALNTLHAEYVKVTKNEVPENRKFDTKWLNKEIDKIVNAKPVKAVKKK